MHPGTNVRSFLAAALIGTALIPTPGCGSDDLDSSTAVKLRAVGNMYLDYVVMKNGAGPDTEARFKAHVGSKPDQVLQPAGIDRNDLNGLFVSDRDGEPFVVRYGLKVTGVSGTDAPLIAHSELQSKP
jgi:hypothetical protein